MSHATNHFRSSQPRDTVIGGGSSNAAALYSDYLAELKAQQGAESVADLDAGYDTFGDWFKDNEHAIS